MTVAPRQIPRFWAPVVRALTFLAASAAVAGLLWIYLGGGTLGLDGAWSVVRGDLLLHTGSTIGPSSMASATTAHPLTTLRSMVVSQIPGDALLATLLCGFVAAGALLVGVAALGRPPGRAAQLGVLVAPLLLLSREVFVDVTSVAYLDLYTAAFLVWFTYLCVHGRQYSWTAAISLLCLGLLKPESWPLAVVIAALAVRANGPTAAWPLLVAAAAPLLWAAFDWATAGDPLASFSATADAERFIRSRVDVNQSGLVQNLLATPARIFRGLGPVLCGLTAAGLAVGWRRASAEERKAALIVIVIAFAFSFGLAIEALAGKRLLVRYLVPVVALGCVLGAFALRWTLRLIPSPARPIVALGLLAALALPHVVQSSQVREDNRRHRAQIDDLRILARSARCGPIVVPNLSIAPQVYWWTRRDVRVGGPAAPVPPAGTLIFASRAAGRDVLWTEALPYFAPPSYGTEQRRYRGWSWLGQCAGGAG